MKKIKIKWYKTCLSLKIIYKYFCLIINLIITLSNKYHIIKVLLYKKYTLQDKNFIVYIEPIYIIPEGR